MTQTQDIQLLNSYLLGALSSDESERLDELSVTDEEVATALRAAECDLVDSYIAGELSANELERFKSHYLASPRRREKLRIARALQTFGENEAARGVADSTEAIDRTSQHESRFRFSLMPRWAFQFGLAAVVLVVLVVGWLALRNMRENRQLAGTQPAEPSSEQQPAHGNSEKSTQNAVLEQTGSERQAQAGKPERPEASPTAERQRSSSPTVSIATYVLTPQVRGTGDGAAISLPAEADYVRMHLKLEPNEQKAYRVSLVHQAKGLVVWRSSLLKATSGSVIVTIPANLIKPQNYTLRVFGISPSGTLELLNEYPFRAVKL
jgi:hypothetical protein